MLIVRQITKDEVDDFIAFLRRIAEWLIKINKEMWSLDKLTRSKFTENNNYNECYFGIIDKVPVASMILKEHNSFMWPEAQADSTLYIGKLGVAREYSGRGYARSMLEYAYAEAQKRGKRFLRLDCYADREYLCSLYEDFGFNLVQKREMRSDIYAALYEMRVE